MVNSLNSLVTVIKNISLFNTKAFVFRVSKLVTQTLIEYLIILQEDLN